MGIKINIQGGRFELDWNGVDAGEMQKSCDVSIVEASAAEDYGCVRLIMGGSKYNLATTAEGNMYGVDRINATVTFTDNEDLYNKLKEALRGT